MFTFSMCSVQWSAMGLYQLQISAVCMNNIISNNQPVRSHSLTANVLAMVVTLSCIVNTDHIVHTHSHHKK